MYRKIVGIEPPDSVRVGSWLNRLTAEYGSLADVSVIGSSLLGRSIYAIHIGSRRRKVLYCGGVHGREWITSLLLLHYAEDLLRACAKGERICDIGSICCRRILQQVEGECAGRGYQPEFQCRMG